MTMEQLKFDPNEDEETRRQRQIELNKPLVALLDEWLAEELTPEEEEEERRMFIEFMRGIDENRRRGTPTLPRHTLRVRQVTRFIVLDSGPLGLLCNSKRFPIVRACAEWSRHQTKAGAILVSS